MEHLFDACGSITDGGKNGSVFRKLLGGALMRTETPSHPCLAPGPGRGHWERQDEKPCDRCRPIERRVSRLLRDEFPVPLCLHPRPDGAQQVRSVVDRQPFVLLHLQTLVSMVGEVRILGNHSKRRVME